MAIGTIVSGSLAWWLYPRPLFVQQLPAISGGYDLISLDTNNGYVNKQVYPHAARWLPIRHTEKSKETYYFLDQTRQTLIGPWSPPESKAHVIRWHFDGSGRFLVQLYGPDNLHAPVYWFNPLTETSGSIPVPKVENTLAHRLSRDKSTMVIAHGGTDRALAFTILDLAIGSVRSSFELPDRQGEIHPTARSAATLGFDVSPDGTQIALTSAWNDGHRLGEFTISIIDTQTGKVIRQITEGQDAKIKTAITD